MPVFYLEYPQSPLGKVVNQLISQITQFCPELRISAIFPHLSEITTPEPLVDQGCVNTC
jgi:hypothetical protein